MATKNKFYAVWKGRQKGVFASWEECKQQIDGYEGAQYKSYPTEMAAREALRSNYWQAMRKAKERELSFVAGDGPRPLAESIAVDAACSGNPGRMEYRGVYVRTGEKIFHSPVFEYGTSNIGEFLALVHGLSLLKRQGSSIPVYSDSENAIKWVRNKQCRTKLDRNDKNTALFDLIARAERWLAANTYPNEILKWQTDIWGEIPADFGRK